MLPDHPIHEEHRLIRSKYSAAITDAKREHWTTFLENLSYSEVWTANCYISGENTDGGKTHIPTLTQQPADPIQAPMVASTNEEKSLMLAKLMFPTRLADCEVPQEDYADQLPAPPKITKEQIWRHITSLRPHKVPGADEIPNIILKKSAKLITLHLLHIFCVVLNLHVYPSQWKDIITCVLHKPGKLRYNVPKVYCPIALVNTIVKLLSSIVVEDISHLVKTHQLLPMTHFGGRLGRSTTDSLHLLVDYIKAAWRHKQVVAVLFLDIKGAFPNAVMDCLLHNLRVRQIPETYVLLVKNMLMGCRGTLSRCYSICSTTLTC